MLGKAEGFKNHLFLTGRLGAGVGVVVGMGGRGESLGNVPRWTGKAKLPELLMFARGFFWDLSIPCNGLARKQPHLATELLPSSRRLFASRGFHKTFFFHPKLFFFPPKIHFCWQIQGKSSFFAPNPGPGDLFPWLFPPLPRPPHPVLEATFPPLPIKANKN